MDKEGFLLQIDKRDHFYATISRNSSLTAFCCGHVRQDYIYISGFQNRLKKGQGARLLRETVAKLCKTYKNCTKVCLVARSDVDLEKLITYYERLGFISHGVDKDFPEEGVKMSALCRDLLL